MAHYVRTCSRLVCASFVLLLAKAAPADAQLPAEPNKVTYWLSGGLGHSSLGSLAGNASGNIQYGSGLISLHASAHAETVEIFGGGDELYDLGLLVGIASRGTRELASFAVGIARVTGSRYIGRPGLFSSGRRVGTQPTIGLPIEAQLFHKLGRIAGLGACMYADINSEQTFGGITLNIQLGKLR